jgi:hypothetical protein
VVKVQKMGKKTVGQVPRRLIRPETAGLPDEFGKGKASNKLRNRQGYTHARDTQ